MFNVKKKKLNTACDLKHGLSFKNASNSLCELVTCNFIVWKVYVHMYDRFQQFHQPIVNNFGRVKLLFSHLYPTTTKNLFKKYGLAKDNSVNNQ